MSNLNKPSTSTKRIRVTLPTDVAEFYENDAKRFGQTVSAVAAPVLCARAWGDINEGGFTQRPGLDLRPQ